MTKPNSKSSPESALVDMEKRLQRFEDDVDQEPWKKQHLEAMRWFEMQDALNRGVCLYRSFEALDAAVRDALLADNQHAPEKTKHLLGKINELFAWWLKPCAHVERELRELEKRLGVVEHAQEFRHCYDEAKWIVDPGAS